MAKPITVSITGNAGPLKKAVGEAEGSLEKLSGSFKKLAAVTAVGVGAIAAGIGFAVKAAAEDQKSFELLNQALKANTDATSEQIKAIDASIGSMSKQLGIADDQLRPAFANLARATGDVTKSQELLVLSTNISAATGKDLEAVSIALSKAYGGNVAGLQKLGIPLDENLIKTKDFNGAVEALSATFGGAAEVAAGTFEGKLSRLKIISGELVEQVGSYLLPIFTSLADIFLNKVVPIIEQVADKIGPFLAQAITKTSDFINDKFLPAFNRLSTFVKDQLIPTFLNFAIPIFESLKKVFGIVSEEVNKNRDTFIRLGEFLKTLFFFIKENIVPLIGTTLKIAFEVLGKIIPPVIAVIANFVDAFVSVGNVVIKVASTVLDTIEAMVNGIIKGVNFAIESLNRLPGINIGTIGEVSVSLPTITAPTVSGGAGSSFIPADRISSPAFNAPSVDIATPALSSGGGSSGGKGSGGSGLSRAELDAINSAGGGPFASSVFANERSNLSDFVSARESAAAPINITVNTVTADANLPNLIVESLQRYNLISGPVDVQIAS